MPAKIDTEHFLGVLRSVPKMVMEEVLGKQRNQLDAIAERWGFPINTSPCDVTAVLRRLADFLKKYGPLLKVLMDDDGEGDENALGVRYLRAKIAKTEHDAHGAAIRNAQKEGRLVDLEQVHAMIEVIANRVNKASDRAQKKWGQEGYEFFADLAAGVEADIRGLIDAGGNGEGSDLDDAGEDASDVCNRGLELAAIASATSVEADS